MRTLCFASTVLAGLLMAGSTLAQDAPAVPVPIAQADAVTAVDPLDQEDTLTWDELPERLQAAGEALIGRTVPQAVLYIEEAFTPEPEMRTVDHGDVLLVQRVRPAGVARITSPVDNAAKYGPMDAVLWPGVGADGDYWCWRADNPATPQPEGNIYCYIDKDGDGASDQLMENDVWMWRLPRSRFQFASLGHDERVRGQARFTIQPDALGDVHEVVAVRYYGAVRGLVSPEGKFGPGRLEFELMAGPDVTRLDEVERIRVTVDADGRGQTREANGIRIEVDGVNLDGTARVRVTSGLPRGRGLLRPPMTRETILAMVGEFLNPDGTPKSAGP